VAWVIVLLVVGVVVWLISAYSGGRTETAEGTVAPGMATPGANGAADGANGANGADVPITDPSQFANVENTGESYVGRDVELTSVQVADAAGRSGFWIDAGGQHVFVRSDKAQFRSGQVVSVKGEIKRLPDDWQTEWNLPAAQASRFGPAGIYIDADEVKSGSGARSGAETRERSGERTR
jgi:hypothetical protein